MPHIIYELWVGHDDEPELWETFTDAHKAIEEASDLRKWNHFVEVRLERSDKVKV